MNETDPSHTVRKNHHGIRYFLGFTAVLLFSTQSIFGQSKIGSSKVDTIKSLLKFTISAYIGLEWEKKIGKKSVVDVFSGILIGVKSDDFTDFTAGLGVVPNIYVEYRNYYNISERLKRQKQTRNNSANFLFGRAEVVFPVGNQNYTNLLFGQGWGLQRSLCKKINLGFKVGLIEHFYFDKPPDGGFNYLKFEPLLQGSFAYVF